MVVALAIDAGLGWPERLFRFIGHPVAWMGAWLSWLDERLNPPRRRRRLLDAPPVRALRERVAAPGRL